MANPNDNTPVAANPPWATEPIYISCNNCNKRFPPYTEPAGEWAPINISDFAVWLCPSCSRHVSAMRAAETEEMIEANHRAHCPHCGGNDDGTPNKPPPKLKLVPPN